MSNTKNNFLLSGLLKRFDESVSLSEESLNACYDFLFNNHRYIPLKLTSEVLETLDYLKDNMVVNNISTLTGLLTHYNIKSEHFESLLNDLVNPGSTCVNVFVSGNEITNLRFFQANRVNVKGYNICSELMCYNPQFSLLANWTPTDLIKDISNSKQLQIINSVTKAHTQRCGGNEEEEYLLS